MNERKIPRRPPLISSRFSILAVWLCLLGSFQSTCCYSQETDKDASAQPTKAIFIETLQSLFELLAEEDYEAAAKYLVLPPDFNPEMLKSLISKQEISQAGIELLSRSAKFGTAQEVFGAERAAYFANRAGVDVQNCYGFNYETEAATAEVIGLWNQVEFKLFRIDDIGKLSISETDHQPAEPKTAGSKTSLPELKLAVESNPSDVAARGNYAMALYQSGRLTESWSQLMEGYRLKPDHRGMAKGIGVLMDEFEKVGVIRVGTSQQTIEIQLGPPRQKVELGSRQRWVYGYLGVDFKSGLLHEIVDLRSSSKDQPEPTEILSINLDGRGWKCGMRKKQGIYSTAVYFLPDENSSNWTEKVEIERITGAAQAGSAREIGELVVKQVTKRHPDAAHKILDVENNSVIVAFDFPGSGEKSKEYQLVRLLKGPRDVHRFAYTIKTEQLPKETENQWLEIAKSASLTPVNNLQSDNED